MTLNSAEQRQRIKEQSKKVADYLQQMTQEHPITPPPELCGRWYDESPYDDELGLVEHVATQAARWGADQQLEKDAKWLDHNALSESHLKVIPVGDSLKEAMRPKPPSLKEQALKALDDISIASFEQDAANIIRRALEQLPND